MIDRDYSQDAELIRGFLEEFCDIRSDKKQLKYAPLLTNLAHRRKVSITVELDDVNVFDKSLCHAVLRNTRRYVNIFSNVISEILSSYRFDIVTPQDSLDIYIDHRLLSQSREANGAADPGKHLPPELLRRFEVYFKPLNVLKECTIREINAGHIGKLVTVGGIVTRTTEVKPVLTVATYTCDRCGAETYQPVNSLTFIPVYDCPSDDCRVNKTGGRLYLQTRGSKFVKFQEVKMQEHSSQVPIGHVPRSLMLLCRGDNTRLAQPGDHVLVSGIFLPLLKTGFRQLSSGLLSDVYLDVHVVICVNKSDVCEENISEVTVAEFANVMGVDDFYSKLAMSIAPEIYGHVDVKKALLLLLVGGTDRRLDGLKIRGNINICLMGDPGVAKSQLLNYIDRLAIRSQYTTGRGSSGVGLTAAVMKDPFTGEMSLEGGALVLADLGICCIDEFDKMADNDRTAIHEVMEQQTISIAKAGIMTTLNSRVSILAAANPAFGRYNPSRTVEQNIQLPAALLSRFDLLWLIQDKADRENDLRLAKHITFVHIHGKQPSDQFNVINMNVIRRYISLCKKKEPLISKELTDYIVGAYVELRREARSNKDLPFTSARNLLGVLRIATALARLRLADEVVKDDVTEALRLIDMSKNSLNQQNAKQHNQYKSHVPNTSDNIFVLIRDLTSERTSFSFTDIMESCTNKGFSPDQVEKCIEEYESFNVWQVNQARTHIHFL